MTITYARTRYRWGKLNECEPSRFINEIDEKYIFKIAGSTEFPKFSNKSDSLRILKPKRFSKNKTLLKPITRNNKFKDLNEGDVIIHNRFGKGVVINTEG